MIERIRRWATAAIVLLAIASAQADDAGPQRAAIRLDAKQRQAIGVTYGVVERRTIDKTIRTVGRFDYDERKLFAVTLKINGFIKDLFVDSVGKPVRKGEPLFTIYSPELVGAEQEYLLALRTAKQLAGSSVPSAAESAASLVRASRERLRLWDLGDQQIAQIEKSGKPNFSETIRSPASGVVIEKMVIGGQSVQAGMMLYKIADLSTIWVYGDIYEYELPFVKVGQPAEIRLSYAPGRTFAARVAYLYPTLDPKTRTVKVRFELANTDDRLLRPEMYGDVEIQVPLGERVVVPKSAVLDSGRRQVAFVAAADGQLTPRDVKLGDRVDDFVEILGGLQPGERVVTSANFLVDSESQLQGADSMLGKMGAIGMGDWKMESAKPMSMGGGESGSGDERRVGDLAIAVSSAGNVIRVRLRDEAGAPIRGAQVSFDYTMDMPGMQIQSVAAKEVGDGVYEAAAKFAMGGPWSVVVQVDRPGKPSLREKFTVRVAG